MYTKFAAMTMWPAWIYRKIKYKMKIGIFIDNFFEAQRYKDPGVIAESLLI